MTFIKVAAPIIPFVTESIYQNLRAEGSKESVHLCMYPLYERAFRDESLEKKTALTRKCISLARKLRTEKSIRVRQPLSCLHVVSRSKDELRVLFENEELIKEEVNVKKVVFSDRETELVKYSAKADFKVLGKSLGAKMKEASGLIEKMTTEDIESLLDGKAKKTLIFSDGTSFDIFLSSIVVKREERQDLYVANEDSLTVGLDSKLTEDLILEGDARDLVREIQNFRKESGFNVEDYIMLQVGGGERVEKIFASFKDYIQRETLAKSIVWAGKDEYSKLTKLNLDFDIYISASK